MNELTFSIYQSGQKVEIAGYYEMVGDVSRTGTAPTRRVLQTLQVEDSFPNYDGRAVCWYLVSQIKAAPVPKVPVQLPPEVFVEYQAGLTG